MRRRSLSIRYRVMALTLLPMTLLALVLGGYFTLTRVAETRANLLEQGQATARLIASASEFGVLSGNRQLLRSLSSGPVRAEEVTDILFYDADFRLLFRSGEFDVEVARDQKEPRLYQGTWHFVAPITARTLPLQDNPELLSIDDGSETLGWVAVLISAQPTLAQERAILMRGAGLTLICLVIALALANRFGRRITYPVLGLTRLIERLQRGELNARADTSYTGELQTLATGINRLATRVQESNLQFEFRVDSATRRLTQTLRHLERRNRELQQERQRADDANRAKDEFLARMSHELRTPLTSVIGFTELLESTRLDRQQKQYLQIVSRTSELLLTIIDDILDFSRLESNAIEIEALEFDLTQRLFDVLEAQSPVAARKGLELTASLPPDLPRRVIGDPTRLSQILNNLLGNAVKFTERGEVELQVRISRLPGDNPRLLICVRDTGIGIAASRIGHLFSAFTQGDSSISRRFGGSGLGLVIAQRLTELMGGKIHLDSVEGQGTRVHLDLPLRYASVEGGIHCFENQPEMPLLLYEPHAGSRAMLLQQLQILPIPVIPIRHLEEMRDYCQDNASCTMVVGVSPLEAGTRHVQQLCDRIRAHTSAPLIFLIPGRGAIHLHADSLKVLSKPPRWRELLGAVGLAVDESHSRSNPALETQLPYPLEILVAEDNEFNRLLIHRLLEGLGARVTEVGSGQEVLDYLDSSGEPDLILMDVHMPGMDGIEATRRVRLRSKTLPIFALTANVVPHEHLALEAAGINGLMLKPINVPELLRALIGLCEEKTGLSHDTPAATPELTNSLTNLTSPDSLQQEVRRLAQEIMRSVWEKDRNQVRAYAHQLIGVAGLYDMPVLESCTSELQQAAQEGDMRALWETSSRLKRVADQEQLE
ncbi:hybrid sensor histidine kinase/response regulator [Marinobacterium lutimaris]|uniref:histidine kinase n=1 Tax=Marinobacterium lutimaris TaxID=568106 RepID=A0A1H6CTT0_9GAMM|nr:hybrid sensor histidine kinase/response regulator [Marinobacterium lutimaris]SEG76364.1 two-component system, NarL family, sensor histidine kinase BarA [Marinobacterium lutimaris]